MMLTQDPYPAGFQNLKIGTRIPLEHPDSNPPVSYLDIGTNISSRLYVQADVLRLDVHADISNLAAQEKDTKAGQPIVRQMVISGSSVIVPGKPLVIGSVDDPNSNREFQLEVTATKLN